MVFNLSKRLEKSTTNWHITSWGGGGGSIRNTYPAILAGCRIQVTPECVKIILKTVGSVPRQNSDCF